ncbi:hypothetical protein LRP30_16140 [Bradyrhizobium sp. C-145]|uniref:hypothetical protein n=1 Tax=Bradyrhizobium sp. C-145 TaxID=574727 RepID=UPI00201B5558|nr:hypothetical protein [Bradyrhizobium sp. C-145]UQR66685.1 hypothetical protein LRP30_16140 [Bradyrhizobium sp. C-145]
MKRMLAAAGLALMCSTLAWADNREWSWSAINFAPCEGVGVIGSYAVKMYGEYDVAANTRTLRKVSLIVDSVAFAMGTPSVSAKLTAGANSVLLQRPWYSTITSPNVVNLVMPPKNPGNSSDSTEKPFSFSTSTPLKVQVSGLISTPAGSCALGTMNRDVTF